MRATFDIIMTTSGLRKAELRVAFSIVARASGVCARDEGIEPKDFLVFNTGVINSEESTSIAVDELCLQVDLVRGVSTLCCAVTFDVVVAISEIHQSALLHSPDNF